MSEFQASNFKKENGGTPDLLGKTELTSPYFFVPPSGDTGSGPESCAPGTPVSYTHLTLPTKRIV